MNNLDDYSLESVFVNVSLIDLINCSQVCKRWRNIIKPKNLFFCYKTSVEKIHKHKLFILDHKTFLEPHYVFDDMVFKYLKSGIFKNISSFIFHGIDNFAPPISFNFYNFSNLKYLEIMGLDYCDSIKKSFLKYLIDKKLDSNVVWKYFSPTIETLIIDSIDISILLHSFTNAKYLLIDELVDKHDFFNILNENKNVKWEKFIYTSHRITRDEDHKQDSIIEFLMKNCPNLKSIEIHINYIDHLDSLLSNQNLKKIFVNISKEEIILPTKTYEYIFLIHEIRIETTCDLFINGVLIKNFNDFKILMKGLRFCKKMIKKNEENLIVFDRNTCVEIYQPSGIELFKTLKSFNFLNNLSCIYLFNCEKYINQLADFFMILPKFITNITIESNGCVTQNILDLIPYYFPYTKTLNIESLETKIYDFNFIKKLNYLEAIYLLVSKMNYEKLVQSFKKLYFLSYVDINVEKKLHEEVLCLFNSFLKTQVYSFDELTFNGQTMISFNQNDN